MAKFQKGKSGNPAGRPKGITDKRTELSKLLVPHAEALVNKAVELALAGDIQALRLCIERLIPRASDESVSIQLPELMNTKKNVALAISTEALKSLSGQQVDVSQAKNLINILNFCQENAPIGSVCT